jgi:hypothetical protein
MEHAENVCNDVVLADLKKFARRPTKNKQHTNYEQYKQDHILQNQKLMQIHVVYHSW